MSHQIDECYSVYKERMIWSTVIHLCGACGEEIRIGHLYTRVSIVFDGSAQTVKRCLRCQTIHIHLRGLDKFGETWPNEDLSCGKDYREEWGVDPPERIQRLAFMTQAESQEELV